MSEKNRDKKSTWALLISIVALLLCLLVLALWVFEVMPHSVIAPDSFIGACVSLLAVVVTLAVGSQIVNIMEVKSTQKACEGKVKQVETELNGMLTDIKNQQEAIEEDKNHNLHIHHYSLAMLAEMHKSYPSAIHYYIGALLFGMKMKESLENEKNVIQRIRFCLSRCNDLTSFPVKFREKLKKNDAEIRTMSNYRWIKEEYEPLFEEFMTKILEK